MTGCRSPVRAQVAGRAKPLAAVKSVRDSRIGPPVGRQTRVKADGYHGEKLIALLPVPAPGVAWGPSQERGTYSVAARCARPDRRQQPAPKCQLGTPGRSFDTTRAPGISASGNEY